MSVRACMPIWLIELLVLHRYELVKVTHDNVLNTLNILWFIPCILTVLWWIITGECGVVMFSVTSVYASSVHKALTFESIALKSSSLECKYICVMSSSRRVHISRSSSQGLGHSRIIINACLSPVHVSDNFWNICGCAASPSFPSHPVSCLFSPLCPNFPSFLLFSLFPSLTARDLAARRHLILSGCKMLPMRAILVHVCEIFILSHLFYSITYLYIELNIAI